VLVTGSIETAAGSLGCLTDAAVRIGQARGEPLAEVRKSKSSEGCRRVCANERRRITEPAAQGFGRLGVADPAKAARGAGADVLVAVTQSVRQWPQIGGHAAQAENPGDAAPDNGDGVVGQEQRDA